MQISVCLRSTSIAQKLIWFSTALMVGENDQAQKSPQSSHKRCHCQYEDVLRLKGAGL